MFKKWITGAATALAVGMLAVGCSDDDSDFIPASAAPIFVTGTFPGAPVTVSYVGNDGRALSHNGQTVDAAGTTGTNWWPNVSSDTGIIFYSTNAGQRLFASYWNGATFTPPVEILGTNYNAAVAAQSVAVLWLNPTALDTTHRVGDALITYTRGELDDPFTTTITENNTRLYCSYFDASKAGIAQDSTNAAIQYGFDTVSHFVDDDESTATANQNVDAVGNGFISDSVFASYNGSNATAWNAPSGQATTFAFAIWYGLNSDATPVRRLFVKAFDLTGAGNVNDEFSSATNATEIIGLDVTTGSISTTTWTAHNGTLLFNTANGTAGDTITNWMQLDNSLTTRVTINRTDTDTVATLVNPGNLYGGDHGLRQTLAIFPEAGFGDGTNGTPAIDADIMLAQLDHSNAAGAVTANVETAEIDAFRDTTSQVTSQAADAALLGTRISNDARSVFVAWTQASTAVNVSTTLATPWVCSIQTEPSTATAIRVIANAVSPAHAMSDHVAGGATAATGTLTATAAPTDGDQVNVDGTLYTFQTTMAAANDVQNSATLATALANLDAAIDGSGTPGTEYFAGTTAVATVTGAPGATTLVVTAVTPGVAGNSIATTVPTGTFATWGAATLTGGSAAGSSDLEPANVKFQEGLENGQGNPACSVQTNPRAVNLIWDGSDNITLTSSDTFELLTNRFADVLDVPTAIVPAAAPTLDATLTSTPTMIDSINQEWDNGAAPDIAGTARTANSATWGANAAVAVDRGDSAGNVTVAYVHQHFTPDATVDTGTAVVTVEPRVYLWNGDENVLIGSPDPAGTLNGVGRTAVVTGTEDVQVAQTSTGAVFLWSQNDITATGGRPSLNSRFWSRSLANGVTNIPTSLECLPLLNSTDLATAGASTATTSDPFFIDDDFATTAALVEGGANGATVEIYFTQGDHLYWNSFSGSAWLTFGGFADPQIVDHDSDAAYTAFVFGDRYSAGCSDTSRMIFWTRLDIDNTMRLVARPR